MVLTIVELFFKRGTFFSIHLLRPINVKDAGPQDIAGSYTNGKLSTPTGILSHLRPLITCDKCS